MASVANTVARVGGHCFGEDNASRRTTAAAGFYYANEACEGVGGDARWRARRVARVFKYSITMRCDPMRVAEAGMSVGFCTRVDHVDGVWAGARAGHFVATMATEEIKLKSDL